MTETAKKTPGARLREFLDAGTFLHMPSVYDPLGARLVAGEGFEAAYVGGYATGGSRAITEPLVTLTEQVAVAREVAESVVLPVLADAGAGFGEPLHTMRTVRKFARAGIHIEDQFYPKRAHYHRYVAHAVPTNEFVAKIRYALMARDEVDPDFLVIARTDTCRELGVEEAVDRLNRCADLGADLGLLFPRTPEEAEVATKTCRLPLVYVQSRGNRDGRPLIPRDDLKALGYVACIDAQVMIGPVYHVLKRVLAELRDTGDYTGLTPEEFVAARQGIEDIIGLDAYYKIEEETVEHAGSNG